MDVLRALTNPIGGAMRGTVAKRLRREADEVTRDKKRGKRLVWSKFIGGVTHASCWRSVYLKLKRNWIATRREHGRRKAW
jgi:hypothetical protein